MTSAIKELYIYDDTVKKGSAMEKLIDRLLIHYAIRTGSPEKVRGRPEVKETNVYIENTNPVILGFWPTEGPVEELKYGWSSEIRPAIETGLITKMCDYCVWNGTPMVSYRLTDNRRQIRKARLDDSLLGLNIHIYLEPRK